MNITKTSIILFATTFALLLSACGGNSQNFDKEVAVIVALTQTASANTSQPAPAPVATQVAPITEVSGDYQPISEQECSDLNALLSQQTGIAGVVTNPAPFDDYVNETSGFGCAISLTTTRAERDTNQLDSPVIDSLVANGWVEDNNYTFPGLVGLVSAYRKGDQLCLTANYVAPIDKSLCPEGEGYFNCLQNLPPEQIRLGYDLNCARPVR